MKKTLIIILLLLLFLPGFVFGQEIVVVMDAERPPYLQALKGFTKACYCLPTSTSGVKSIHTFTSHQVILGNRSTKETIANIRSFQPDLILAMGYQGLEVAVQVPDVPIIYLLVANPNRIVGQRDNITGIELRLPATLQLQTMHKHLPDMKRLGVIYNQKRTGKLIAEAQKAAQDNAISLVALPLRKQDKFSELLKVIQKEKIDAFWMIPDITILSPTTLHDLLLFSLEKKIPLITFANRFLQQGAAISITFDMQAIGVQAGEIALSVLDGTPIADIPPQAAKKATVKGNKKIIKKLGINFNKPKQTEGAP